MDDICFDKYIYLDWQVFKYCMIPRKDMHGDTDNEFSLIIKKLKRKYKIPYSEGHVRDRANKYTSENRRNVENDFKAAETLNDQYCLATNNDGKLVMVKKPMLSLFDEIIQETDTLPHIDPLYFHEFQVDMSKLDSTHPLYHLLLKTQGKLNSYCLKNYLEEISSKIFLDNDLYKSLRSTVAKLNLDNLWNERMPFDCRLQLDSLLYYMTPMLEAIHDDRATLVRKWPAIVERWLKMNGHKPPMAQDLLMIQGYSLLDIHPLFNDKLKKKKNTLDNIHRDGIHCYYASGASYYVSEDEKTREKAKFIYEAYGLKTKVLSESGLLRHFECLN